MDRQTHTYTNTHTQTHTHTNTHTHTHTHTHTRARKKSLYLPVSTMHVKFWGGVPMAISAENTTVVIPTSGTTVNVPSARRRFSIRCSFSACCSGLSGSITMWDVRGNRTAPSLLQQPASTASKPTRPSKMRFILLIFDLQKAFSGFVQTPTVVQRTRMCFQDTKTHRERVCESE